MAFGRVGLRSHNFEVFLLFLIYLYVIFRSQSRIFSHSNNFPGNSWPKEHATIITSGKPDFNIIYTSSHYGRTKAFRRLPSVVDVKALSKRGKILSFTIYFFCTLICCGDIHLNPGPPAENLSLLDDLSTLRSHGKHDITVGHTNVRGLYKNLSQVKLMVFRTGLDVLAVTETHLSPAIEDHEISIQGYQIQRKDRIGKAGGGVAVYYKVSLDCISIEKYDDCGIEATWLELKVQSQRLLVGCVYRPPDFRGFYDKFRPILERISMTRKNVIITGDFNSNMLDDSGNGKKLKDILQLAGFKNVVKKPTRVTEHSSTIINLICTNNIQKVNSAGVIDFCIADHKLNLFTFLSS